MHPGTFEYLNPLEWEKGQMAHMRAAFGECAQRVLTLVPEGPDRDHVLRTLRDAMMWANEAITRNPDGSQRNY